MFSYSNNYANSSNNNGKCLYSSSDEMSSLLHQILVHSSSSPSSSGMAHWGGPTDNQRWLSRTPAAATATVDGFRQGVVLAVDSSGSAEQALVGVAADNDNDEYDFESEEGLEALVDEAAPKQGPPRSSSKRSRAAEVHNLSEKRRRSRINEKMKALQNLIPNSNKTDKASMLDEAIEYLKQLQLQVQMLSMRNGLSLHPMCLPGVLQPNQFSQTRIHFGEENASLPMNMSGTVPADHETSAHMVYDLPNRCSSSNHASVSNMSNIIPSETSFGLDSGQAQYGPFQLLASSQPQDICREDILPHHQLTTHRSEFGSGATSIVSAPFDTQESNFKESGGVDSSMIGRHHPSVVLIKNMEDDLILPPHLTGKK